MKTIEDQEKECLIIMSILSNYTPECLVKTWVECDFEELENLENGDLYEVDEFVFRLRDGSGLNRSTLNNSFKQCLQQCGFRLKHTDGSYYPVSGIYEIITNESGTCTDDRNKALPGPFNYLFNCVSA